jgi:hypothetical protein
VRATGSALQDGVPLLVVGALEAVQHFEIGDGALVLCAQLNLRVLPDNANLHHAHL